MPSRDPWTGTCLLRGRDPEWMALRDSRTARRRGGRGGSGGGRRGPKDDKRDAFGLAEDLRCPGERRCLAQLHRPLARTAPTVAGLYSCLWVFLRTGTMPITCPSFTHPSLPAKHTRNPVSTCATVSGEPTLAHSAMPPPVDHDTT
jgi:hypothetical protein